MPCSAQASRAGEGRERWNHLNALPIKRIQDRWIGPYAMHAVELLDRVERMTT